MDKKVAELLKPNKSSCMRPRVSCAGANFDERMPLDNELSTTMDDPVESSWKHYLDLARAAATTSDQLGSDLIVSQLNVDLRNETVELRQEQRTQDAETAIDDLQQACGTNVDPMKLLLALSGTSDPLDLSSIRQRTTDGTTVTCAANSECDGSRGYECLNGVCMRNALDPGAVLASTTDASLKDALSRISECIGQGATAPFVSLGTASVCLWYPKDTPSQICKSSDANKSPCPVFVPASGSCDSITLPPGLTTDNTTVKLVDRQLGYFSSPAEPTPTPQLCRELQAVRSQGQETSELDQVIATEIFHPSNLVPLARSVGWTAFLGGGAAVTLNGHTLYSPRDPVFQAGGRLGWCAGCTTNEDWAKLDDRVLRAVVALHGTTIEDLRSIYLPFYMETGNVFVPKSFSSGTYPGTTIPMQVTQREVTNPSKFFFTFPFPDEVSSGIDGLPGFTQYHLDTTATVPTAWRAPAANGGVQSFAPTFTENGRTYEFAIGNVATLTDGFNYRSGEFPDGRVNFWGHMSSSAIHAAHNGLWDAYTSPGAAFPDF